MADTKPISNIGTQSGSFGIGETAINDASNTEQNTLTDLSKQRPGGGDPGLDYTNKYNPKELNLDPKKRALFVTEPDQSSTTTTSIPAVEDLQDSTSSPNSTAGPTPPHPVKHKNSLWDKAKNVLSNVISFPGKVVGSIAKGSIEGASKAIGSVVSGIGSGIKSGFNTLKEATKPIWKPVENIVKGIKHIFS